MTDAGKALRQMETFRSVCEANFDQATAEMEDRLHLHLSNVAGEYPETAHYTTVVNELRQAEDPAAYHAFVDLMARSLDDADRIWCLEKMIAMAEKSAE